MQLTITIPGPGSLLRHWKWGMLGALALLLALNWGSSSGQQAEATTGSPDLSILVTSFFDNCNTTKSSSDLKCNIEVDTQFTVETYIDKVGANFPNGYSAFQARLDYSAGLTLKNRLGQDEVLGFWPDCAPFEDKAAGSYIAGCVGPNSFFTGLVMETDFNCGPTPSVETVTLNHGLSLDTALFDDGGTPFADPDADEVLTINCIQPPQEINITTQSVQIPLPHACYNIDDLVLGGSFNVCDNDLAEAGLAAPPVSTHPACLQDGTPECNDDDPAPGKIRVAVVAGNYNVTQKQASPNHNLDPTLYPCSPTPGVKCEVAIKNTAQTNPWHPPDLTGDGKVRIPDIVAVVKCFGLDKPAPLDPYPCP